MMRPDLQFPQYSEAQNKRLCTLLARAERHTSKSVGIVDRGEQYSSDPLLRFECSSRARSEREAAQLIYRNKHWRHSAEAERTAAAIEEASL